MPQTVTEKRNLEPLADAAHLRGSRMDRFTERPFSRLFEEQVANAPHQLAVIYENEQLTFAELNTRANQLARYLQSLGAGAESLIGICVERSLDMAVGILGILKSGAAYLPLDPDYPQERLAFMIDDARPALVLTKSTLADRVSGRAVRAVLLDSDRARIAEQNAANLSDAPGPDDLAYVIYTSGSTGKPKGVMITHGNLANYLLALDHELQITPDDFYLHAASIAFSSSRRQLMLPLSQGATVVIATSEQRKDPLALFAMIKQCGVTIMDAVPSFWRNCTAVLKGLDAPTRSRLLDNKLRLMLSASEPLLSDLPRTWASEFRHPARHVHMFGQTETAGIVALYRIPLDTNGEAKIVPIGKPIANSEIFILDEAQRLCPHGVAGELYIGGAGVGRGYLNSAAQTSAKFFAHPFSDTPGARLYRTGDWARLNADGEIEFVGRRDQQVKLRGFRVELGEIEAALAGHPAIRECAVIARKDTHGEKRLVAYFVANDAPPSVTELRAFMSGQLPDYVVPSAFVKLDALPLSANGKVNRLALPDPGNARPDLAADYVAPRTTIEKRLSEIWSEVLRIERVGVHDNFFELGGHSLLAAQVVARIRNELGIEAPLRTLFASPTVALLAAQMQEEIKSPLATEPTMQLPKLSRCERDKEAPLSFAQQRLWFLDQLEPDGSSYNIRRAIQIKGELDIDKLRQALETIVARHEILRTNFVSTDGHPVQIINQSVRLPLELVDLRGFLVAEREAQVEREAAAEGQRRFDLAHDPLLRVRLVRLDDDEYIFLLTIHHIISDGWSIGVLLSELAALYHAFNADQSPDLPSLQIQYADFALWQRSWLKDKALEQQLTYWKQQLKDAPAALDLPTDYPRSPVQSFRGAQQSALLPADLCVAIKALGQREGVTLFMTLLAAFQTLLYRYSGQDDIVVGSPIAGRTMVEIEPLIGFFVNTLALRTDLSGNPTFRELLDRIREVALGAYTHQDVPFEKLVEELHPQRSLDRTPLFQVMFALQNAPMPQFSVNGLRWTPVEVNSTTAKFDLTLDVVEEGRELRVSLEYNTDLFAAETISRMLGHFQALLNAVAADARQGIADLVLLSEKERRQLLVEWNDTETEYPRAACVHHLFENQVEKTPAAIAATFEDEQITYYELNRRANQLAQFLRKQGVGPEVLVGICVERSLEMLIGLLGILKAGGAYVPLDPAFPKERLAFMIEDANVPVLLTQQKLTADLPVHQAKLVCLDADWEMIAGESAADPSSVATSDNLAYVIYTSGSTGKPKGAMITHGAICNRLLWMQDAYQLDASDRVLQKTPFSFDVSVWEFFWPLITGATLVVARPGGHQDSAYLTQVISEQQITTMHFVPSMLAVFLEEQGLRNSCASLRRVICSGEALPYELQERFFARLDADLHNLYGPTEAAVDVTFWQCERGSARQIVPIGRPISNIQMYALDADMRPVPVGMAGELHIGGIGLARGYLNRPELTTEKFVRNPFSRDAQARLYKTGDLGRYLPDGNIEYLGRVDDQVKIRGFRIELGEIESTLRQHAKVRESVVVAREDTPGNKLLVGYVVPATDAKLDSRELRAFLQDTLPEYMIPAMLVELPELPLTPSGKVNRRALPAPDYCAQLDESYVAPRTVVEELLSGIWAEVLKVSRVGVNDNFFELGGHSLLATQVVSRALKTLGAQLPLRAIFEAPTVAGMAERIEALPREDTGLTTLPIRALSRNSAAPLSFGQQSFWLLDSLTPNTSVYNIFRVVRLGGNLNVSALQKALDGVMDRHESMRTTFPSVNGEPVQVILQNQRLPLSEIDLSSLSPAAREPQLQNLLNVEAQRPFDLAHGPLVRATLFGLDAEEHVLLLSMHHIIADDWSMGILSRDLEMLYDSFVISRPPQLPELPIQYPDFALWQHACLQDNTLDRQLGYWKRQLAGAPKLLELPTDRPRRSAPTLRGARHTLTLPPALHDQLVKLSRREGVSLFMTLLAAFQTLLGRYSGQDDIVVGSPIAGRNRVETENLIGQFVNTLVLRTSLFGDPTFSELLRRVRDVALGAYAHQETPFEKLVEELQPERSVGHMPLFQAMFVFQNALTFDLKLSGLSISREKLYNESSPLDLTLEARETAEGVCCVFEYKTELFDATTIERFAERFQLLLERIIAAPEQRLSDLSLLSESEREKLLVEWNDTAAEFSNEACIHELFEAQVAKTPDAMAAEFAGEQLTYRELNARANRLARYLANQGVGPEVLVGVCIERSLDMLVSILAVLKAGGAYVPLDPTYPSERLAFMIEDAGLSLLLTQERLVKDIPPSNARIISVDTEAEIIARESEQSPAIAVTPRNLAYIIYTSGSTGNPKGVAVEHRSLVNFVEAAVAGYEIKPGDRVLQFASLSFDLSAEEIYPALTCGATVVLRTDEMISSPGDFLNQCDAWRVTVLDLPTAYWHELTDALDQEAVTLPASVRLVIIGGEKALLERVRVWQRFAGESVRLVNSYGPTETTVVATMCDLRQEHGNGLRQNVSIGRPILNTTVFVLDELRRPVPIGVPGELYIGGAGVARGYLNRPELTAERFISDPFSKDPTARLYRTGDVVRYGDDGNIEFVGRADNQIKIRGFRVELGEIEEALRNYPAVTDSVVVLFEDEAGDKRLVAYVVPAGESQLTLTELRSFLKAKLPSYMLPAALETIAALPLMPNGKIDRRALPEPQPVRPEAYESFVAPRTLMEALLASAWCEALKLERVGVHDNFFELGGHSLLAARVVANLRHTMQIELGMVDVLRSPTISELAALLEARRPRDEQESDLDLLLAELAGLSDEEAQQRLTSEMAQDETEQAAYAEA